MSDFTVTVPSPQEWDRPLEQAKKAVSRVVELMATEVWGNIREEAPVEDGRLSGSFTISRESDLSWKISTNVEYAEAIQEGTKARTIVPVRAKALAFKVGKNMVIVKKVNRPAVPANPYITRAIDAAETRRDEFMRRAIQEVS